MIPVARPYLTSDEAQAAHDTVLTGWVTQGPKVQEFEQKFADYVGASYAVAVSSCTTALHLALIAAGIRPGDEIICPSLSFIATANAVQYAGAVPIFADIDSRSQNIDVDHVEPLITARTKAILIVHQIGMPAQIDAFRSLCSKKGLILVEDAACAAGSEYKGRKIGCHSDLVCFSFHPRKVITTGDGGMIATPREEYRDRIMRLRQHSMTLSDLVRHGSRDLITERYTEVGYNYRMTDIQAAVGVQQLVKLDWLVQERRRIAGLYNQAFESLDSVRTPKETEGCRTNYQSYSLYLKSSARLSRNALMRSLFDKGISTRRGIMAIHREPPYQSSRGAQDLPNTEDVSDHSILLPLFVGMKDSEIETVINAVRAELG